MDTSIREVRKPWFDVDAVQITTVYKFGGSSVADADRMREVAAIVCAFPDHLPAIVISAMGKTTNLLLAAGAQAIERGTEAIPTLKPLREIKELHRATCMELGCDTATVEMVEKLLTELRQLLTGIAIMQVCHSASPHPTPHENSELPPSTGAGLLEKLRCDTGLNPESAMLWSATVFVVSSRFDSAAISVRSLSV